MNTASESPATPSVPVHSLGATTEPRIGLAPPSRRLRGSRTAVVVSALAAAAMLTAGCTGGPGSEQEFVEVLRLDGAFTENEAACIADAVFAEYGDDDNAMTKISGAESYEWLTGEDGVEGFDQFFPGAVSDCTTVGPSPDQ